MRLTINDIKTQKQLLFECISGSKAYNLDLPTSDTDLKGVFVAPKEQFLGLHFDEQVNNETNDEVYYEIGRFIELLTKSNPNLLEMLSIPKDKILLKNDLYDLIKPEYFISKKCKDTFAGYAKTQIKKARGLNKKILNPMEKERKTILDFCYILQDHKAVPFKKWLIAENKKQENCGLVNIPHSKNLYALFYADSHNRMIDSDNNVVEDGEWVEGIHRIQGIQSAENANDVSLSSVPKSAKVDAYLSFNKDAYSVYCKDYKEYWKWVERRNDIRYQNTLEHGKNYDAKNMMHTFRLLDMAEEIAKQGTITVNTVFRSNRTALLAIKAGNFTYDTLLERAEQKLESIEKAYKNCNLPAEPNFEKAEAVLIEIRECFYGF